MSSPTTVATSSSSLTNLRLVHHRYGAPQEVLELEESVMPPLQSGRVRVKMLAAPIHPSDFGRIGGSYGNLATLPQVAGREGIGEVWECGESAGSFATGDRVLLTQHYGTWQQYADYLPEELYRLPHEFPVEAGALFQVNPPTAWRLLDLYSESRMAGTPMIQNAGNSSLGILIGQLARSRNIPVIHLARSEEARANLRELGFEWVFADDDTLQDKLAGIEKPGFAINSIGGESVMRLIKAVRDEGEVVTLGGMVRDKVRFPTRELIFKQIRLSGFWLDQWGRTQPEQKRQVWDQLVDWIMRERPVFPVAARFPLTEYAKAVDLASQSRWGKVLFSGTDE